MDLRKIGKVVRCIKDIENKFNKDSYYNVYSFYGDPLGAINVGINDYLPVEFISMVLILDNNNKIEQFIINVNNKYETFGYKLLFFEYFEIPEFSDDYDKYNI